VQLLAYNVLVEQYRRRRLNDEVDLFFPHPAYVLVLRELLKLTQEQFASTAISEPFGLSVLGRVSAVNPRALTTEDFVRIRANDELFAEWRAFLGRVFREIHSHEQIYTSLEAEYAVAVREELVSWRERFDTRLQRGSMSHAWAESGTNISIGVVTGAVTGMIGGDPTATVFGTLAGGALGGLVQPAIELLKNVVKTSVNKPNSMTLRHHFLALGLSEDEVRGRA